MNIIVKLGENPRALPNVNKSRRYNSFINGNSSNSNNSTNGNKLINQKK